MKLPENGNMEEHLNEMIQIDQLTVLKERIADHLIVAFLLWNLTESYVSLVTALECTAEADLALGMMKEKLLQDYRRLKESKIFKYVEKMHSMPFQ